MLSAKLKRKGLKEMATLEIKKNNIGKVSGFNFCIQIYCRF